MAKTLLALIVVHGVWLGWSATLQSPTLNEPGHLVAGLAIWDLGRFDVYRVNPPLVKFVLAVPVVAVGAQRNWDKLRDGAPGSRSEFELGNEFIHANGNRSMRLFVLSRWACIPFSLLGAWLCFIWGRALYGPKAGILAATLWCLDPTIIAHGQLITPDIPGAALGLAASFTFWHWLSEPSWGRALRAGAVLGLANLAKTSWLILFAVFPALWVIQAILRWRRCPLDVSSRILFYKRASAELGQAVVQLLLALYVINLGYLFDGTGTRLGDFPFISQRLSGQEFSTSGPGNRFRASWLNSVPVPVPRQYLLGLDHQQRDFESFPMRSYLRGEWKYGGWWYYYLYAAVIKVPCGTWILVLLAITSWLVAPALSVGTVAFPQAPEFSPTDRLAWGKATLVVPGMCVFLLASSQTGFNHHFRYVLPTFGPLVVLVGSLAERAFDRRAVRFAVRALMAAALGWIALSSVWYGSQSLSYFNEIVGGPEGGRFHLLHSNLDWGQDLLRLKAWQQEHPHASPLKVAYYGLFDPADLGVHCEPLAAKAPQSRDGSLEPGWYAVSINYLMGCEWPPQPFDLTELSQQTWISCGHSLKVIHLRK